MDQVMRETSPVLKMKPSRHQSCGRIAGLLLVSTLLAGSQNAPAAGEENFASPDAAINALRAATASHDTNALHAIFGPEGHQLVSADAVQATGDFNQFAQRLEAKVEVVTNTDGSLALQIGPDAWPFPIPLASRGGQWFFDTAAGRQEILHRRIGQNELGAIDVCRAYVEAQREYASADELGDGVPAYAQYLHSTPGKRDGLYWPAQPGEPLSPLGPLVADARGEGYRHPARMLSDQQAPYHGYYFKILTAQGRQAPGGKYDYLINGRMIAGFALVAWPAQWANTGVMTFIVNQQGRVYQCNLGPKTARLAPAIKRYDPDSRWTAVP